MKSSAFIFNFAIALLSGGAEAIPAAVANPKCSHNNCLRAVIAGSFPERPTVADCSSYLHKTVTPAAATETIWETITPATLTATSYSTQTELETVTVTALETIQAATETVTVTAQQDIQTVKKRGAAVTVHPSVQPAYASSCRTAGAYSSACSCIGVTETTTTVATPTLTVYSTSTVIPEVTIGLVETVVVTVPATVTQTESQTVTATVTVTPQTIPPRFALRAVGGPFDGQVIRDTQGHMYSYQFSFSNDATFPALFTYNTAEGILVNARPGKSNLVASISAAYDISSIYFTDAITNHQFGLKFLKCSVDSQSLLVSCGEGDMTKWYTCGPSYYLWVGNAIPATCQALEVKAVEW